MTSDDKPTMVVDEMGPESHYLVRQLGVVLSYYVTEVVLKRPSDPIEYLAHCLKNYTKAKADEENEKREEQLIEELRQKKELEDEQIQNTSVTTPIVSEEIERKLEESLSAAEASVVENEAVSKTDEPNSTEPTMEQEPSSNETTENVDEDTSAEQ